jgi:hypothetical protein
VPKFQKWGSKKVVIPKIENIRPPPSPLVPAGPGGQKFLILKIRPESAWNFGTLAPTQSAAGSSGATSSPR